MSKYELYNEIIMFELGHFYFLVHDIIFIEQICTLIYPIGTYICIYAIFMKQLNIFQTSLTKLCKILHCSDLPNYRVIKCRVKSCNKMSSFVFCVQIRFLFLFCVAVFYCVYFRFKNI